MTHGSPGRHLILAQGLHRFIDYPALYMDIVYVHVQCPTSMDLNVNVIVELRQSHAQLHMHHRLTRYIIIATIYNSPAIESKN